MGLTKKKNLLKWVFFLWKKKTTKRIPAVQYIKWFIHFAKTSGHDQLTLGELFNYLRGVRSQNILFDGQIRHLRSDFVQLTVEIT